MTNGWTPVLTSLNVAAGPEQHGTASRGAPVQHQAHASRHPLAADQER